MTTRLPKNPYLTVDVIIKINEGVILIRRKNPPHGWALPGGFVDYGESLEKSAQREAKEETSLDVRLLEQFHAYSNPSRDNRFHSVSVVYIAKAEGVPKADDDAEEAGIFQEDTLPQPIVFDHARILSDYFRYQKGEGLRDIFTFR